MWKFDRFAQNTAVVTQEGIRVTYAELQQLCDALSAAAGGRCLVFSMCENSLGSLLGYAAFLNHAIVPAMLKADLDPDLFAQLYANYTPKYIWAPATQESRYSDCIKVYESCDYALLRTPFGDACDLHDDLALLLTTSGSTGSPKFVRQSYANIRANTDSIVEYLHLDSTEKAITTLPMNYTYGISIINTHLDVGASLLLTEKTLMQKEFWSFFKEEGATSFGGVPYTYEMLKRLRMFRMDLPSLRTMTQAGGKLLPELHHEFAEYAMNTGRNFVVMYGQCEATARMAYLPADKSLEKFGSMGIAIPGGKFRLVDVNGDDVTETETTGELIYYGKNVTMGYAERKEDLIKGDERGGVLETGDMAQVDSDGYYTIVGRKKRFLKIFGNRVNLDEAERMLKAQFPMVECACGGVDDKMCIYTTQENAGADMRAFLAGKTGLNPSAFSVKFIPEIPKNEAGKTLYTKL